MAIVEVRIDDRLIHGQVVGYWVPQFKVERILIVDDEIVNDEIRKNALKFGCPAQCKLSIFGAAKAAEKLNRKIDEGVRVMLLCRTPQPFVDLADNGYLVDHITIGNMSTKANAKHIHKNIFVSPEECAAFNLLADKGVQLSIQYTPVDTKIDATKLFR